MQPHAPDPSRCPRCEGGGCDRCNGTGIKGNPWWLLVISVAILLCYVTAAIAVLV